jgi:epoxyqueuosine reductase
MEQRRKSSVEGQELKDHIIDFCTDRGADLVGFAPVARWDDAGEVPPDFRPQTLWPPARSVIVIGLEMPLPIVETTPSVLHRELYRTANQ